MKTVIEMAKAAGLFTHKEVQPEIERFAALIRADEREACAKVCADADKSTHPADLAEAIRARSNT